MKDSKILPFLKLNRIRLPLGWRHSCNCIRYHNRNETKEHFFAKAEIGFEIMKQGGTIFTEIDVGTGVADLLFLGQKIIIEFESNLTEKKKALKYEQYKKWNVFVFDINKTTVEEMMKKIGLK